jgi:hypothetical protein
MGSSTVGPNTAVAKPAEPSPQPSPPASAEAPPVEFSIHDHLGDGEISEQLTVIIDGKLIGNLTVNGQYPDASLLASVPEAGQHSYMVDARAVFSTAGGQAPAEYVGAGEGMINVAPGKRFDMQGTQSGTTWLVVMVEQ